MNASGFGSAAAPAKAAFGGTVGTTTGTSGTETGVTDAEGFFSRLTTDATAGRTPHWDFQNAAGMTWTQHNPSMTWQFRTGSDITTIRIWFALVDSAFTNSDAQAARKGVGMRYSSVAGDTGWMVWYSDGTTQTVGSQITTIAASTLYTATISVAGSTTTVTVNGTSQSFTTPSITSVGLWGSLFFIPTAASARSMDLASGYLHRN
jgi:hypothetical protein